MDNLWLMIIDRNHRLVYKIEKANRIEIEHIETRSPIKTYFNIDQT